MMSGHRFNPTMVYPCLRLGRQPPEGLQDAHAAVRAAGRSYVEKGFGGGTAGYLGIVHNPFEILADPSAENFSARDITPPPGVDADRLRRRRAMLGVVDALQRQGDRQPAAFDSLDKHYQAALNLITAPETKRAFEIGLEDPRLRDRLRPQPLRPELLLARRLVEAGVRFVTVSDPSWDTHADNFKSLKNPLMPRVDQGVPGAAGRPAKRGLLDTTLVVWLTDFGRTPKINSACGRDHWASAGFAIMAGAGIPGGSVVGRTDREGGVPTDARILPRGRRRDGLHEARHSARPDHLHAGRAADPPQRGPAHPRVDVRERERGDRKEDAMIQS